MSRRWLLSTTALSGVATAMLLSSPASAADVNVPVPLPPKILDLPAVSEPNAKFDLRAGTFYGDSLFVGSGAFTLPLSHRWGAQLGGFVGSIGGNLFLEGEGHLFWRDPTVGLWGLYAEYSHLEDTGGLATIAGESELYWGQWTFSGLLGYQFSTDKPQVKDSLYLDLKLALYATPDLKFYGGYRYDQRVSQGVAGAEWELPLNTNTGVSVFGEGRFGQGTEAWGGVRLYFGKRKPLIDRQRQDDPPLIMIVPHGHTVQYTTFD